MFNQKIYKQERGAAMGFSASPSYTNLTMGWWELQVAWSGDNDSFVNKIVLWLQFIDKLLIIWNGTKMEFEEYFQSLNTNDYGLTFTYESSNKEVVFLDTKIYISNNCIQTTLHRKSTATNAVLYDKSHHPKHVVMSIPYGKFLRVRRNCS